MAEDKMETKFPVNIAALVPSVPTSMDPLSILAAIHQANNPRNKPTQAARTAPVPEALGHVNKFHNGATAEPITTPINKYTQPKFKPSSYRMMEKHPMNTPNSTTTKRDTNNICSPSALMCASK